MANTRQIDEMRPLVRKLKSQGKTYKEIGEKLGLSGQMANYYGRPQPGERVCSLCCQPLTVAERAGRK
jgi:hypothetical protein